MRDAAEIRRTLVEQLLDSSRREYDLATETWRALETKAQVSLAAAGVFLAAVFAFARDLSTLTSIDIALLGLAIVGLVAAVLCGLAVFHVQEITVPPVGPFIHTGTFDLLKKPDSDLAAYAERFAVEQATRWSEAAESIARVNAAKAMWVGRSQGTLVVAISLTGLLTIVGLFK